MRSVVAPLVATVAVMLLPVAATAEPARDALVRPGKGIGKVDRGMTLEQVERALGGAPHSVVRRLELPSGGRYVELQWEFEGDRGPSTWTVGFRGTQRGSKLRVVRVSTSVPSQRTREGLGVGSRLRAILRIHPNAECVTRSFRNEGFLGLWVVVRHADAGMTAFLIHSSNYGYGAERPSYEVLEVLVQGDWFSKGPGHGDCPSVWRSW